MPNSGAFRSLHCLIYKVLAPSAQRRNINYLSTTLFVCQALFPTSFEVFLQRSHPNPSGPDSLIRLSHLICFVKTYFSSQQNFFRCRPLKLDCSRTACLMYHPVQLLSTPFFALFRFVLHLPILRTLQLLTTEKTLSY